MTAAPTVQKQPGIGNRALGVLAVAVLLVPRPALADDDPTNDSAAQQERARAMRRIAERVTIQTDTPRERRPVERLAEPIYKFVDPARALFDGSIWAWGRSGRPEALLTLSTERSPEGYGRWLCELTSLSRSSLVCSVGSLQFWAPDGAGVTLQAFPKAPSPAAESSKRMREMKELARRFSAYELFTPRGHAGPERYELRLLPQPIHRYSDEPSGLVDGALFLLSYGSNPEVVVLIEAQRKDSVAPVWHYGLARIAGAELHVDLDGRDVWTQSRAENVQPRQPYWIFLRPLDGGS